MTASSVWQNFSEIPRLHNNEVHLYRFSLDVTPSPYRNLLSADEESRAQRLLDSQKQHFFITGRGKLRQILSLYLDLPAQNVVFSYHPDGKPSLAPSFHSNITFNLSHSADLAVVAVSRKNAVGTDIEKIDYSLNYQQLSKYYFNDDEQNTLRSATTVRKRRTFYRLWTAKEARLKMVGTGFTQLQSKIETPAFLCHFYTSPDAIAALACSAKNTVVAKFNFPH